MQPYTNPYYFQGNPAYQNQNPTIPYQDRLAQLQNQYNQVMPYNQMQQTQQSAYLNGQMVGSLDEVKAKDVDLSGAPMWFPKADGTTVYRKQLQADGTSKILTYMLSTENNQEAVQQPVSADVLNILFDKLRQDLMEEISGIKDMLPTQMSGTSETPKTTKGGTQK